MILPTPTLWLEYPPIWYHHLPHHHLHHRLHHTTLPTFRARKPNSPASHYSPNTHLSATPTISSLPISYPQTPFSLLTITPSNLSQQRWQTHLVSSHGLWQKGIHWIAGRCKELKSLKDLKVFVLIPQTKVPHGQQPLKGKLVCKCKHDNTGKVVCYKVHYVPKGFTQHYGVDYNKTTAPTVQLESVWGKLHLAATLNWDLKQFDITTAFLHGILPEDETMYMEQPPGFTSSGKEEWVMWLMKSIYRMKQTSWIWNQTFHNAVMQWGFECLDCEWCIYHHNSPTGTIIFAVHINDIIAAGSSPKETEQFHDLLKSKWEITELGEPRHTLGIAISCNHENHTISLSQSAKIDQLVNEYSQKDTHSIDTLMVPGIHLRQPDKSTPIPTDVVEWSKRTLYHSLVGSLMYIAVVTQPDISYTMGHLSLSLDCYRTKHWSTTICILHYLKCMWSYALTLGGQSPIKLSGYLDSDYANCIDTSWSIGGYCFMDQEWSCGVPRNNPWWLTHHATQSTSPFTAPLMRLSSLGSYLTGSNLSLLVPQASSVIMMLCRVYWRTMSGTHTQSTYR